MMAATTPALKLGPAYEGMVTAMRARGRILVAYSGGVDSGLVARVARDAVGGDALAVIADAESLARRELDEALAEAAEIGIAVKVIRVSELANDRYVANPTNRCYFCRQELGGALRPIAAELGYQVIADGVNLSDLGDHRPGIQAMNEAGFWHPLVEFGLAKQDVRALAEALGLTFYDKPSNACLSSRIPHQTRITVTLLQQVEAAEAYLRSRGFRQVRVRHHGEIARIEVVPEDIPRLRSIEEEVAMTLRSIGYQRTLIDPNGYRSLG
ncbi:MAG TPA: ATP-dependent sacrificial sulfur transferase LarE [Thermoplasmata archaeon]